MTARSHVRNLALDVTLAAPDAASEGRVRDAVQERFVPGVLAALERAVHRRLGRDGVLRIRYLGVDWRLSENDLTSSDRISALGSELAEAVLDGANLPSRAFPYRPNPEALAVWFDSQAHYRAAHLVARHHGQRGSWLYRPLESGGDPWAEVCDGGASLLVEVVAWLTRMNEADGVLATLPAAIRQRVVDVLPPHDPIRSALLESASSRHGMPPAVVRPAPGGAAPAPETPPAERTTPLSGGGSVSARGSDSREATGGDSAGTRQRSDRPLTSGQPAAPGESRGPAERGLAINTDSTGGSSLPARVVEAQGIKPPSLGSAVTGDDRAVEEQLEEPLARFEVATRYAGAFYLLARVHELELAEHLWCVGALEGSWLAHIVAAILGDEGRDDPAAALFGGLLDLRLPRLAPLADWALEEVLRKATATLARALERRGLSSHWGDGESAELERLSDEMRPEPDFVDAASAGLVAHCAAALVTLFQRRLGEHVTREACASRLAVAGRVELAPGVMRVVLPMAALDLDVRRAGLDFDPGHVVWLDRQVELVYEERSEDHAR